MTSLLHEMRKHADSRTSAEESDQSIVAFLIRGDSVKAWAKFHNFHPELVYSILKGKRKCLRGESLKIARELGMK
jgi:gp16 family phage-associated protein